MVTFGVGGFVPSIAMLCKHHLVWSVQHNAPHSDVNAWLILHIIGALTWGVVMPIQLGTGGVHTRRTWHIAAGYLGYGTLYSLSITTLLLA